MKARLQTPRKDAWKATGWKPVLRFMKCIPFFTLTLACIAAGVAVLPPAVAGALEFSREAFARGEVWRVWTAHLTHFGAGHLQWDLFALLLLGAMAEMRSRRDWVVAVAVSAPVIVLGVWWLQPQFEVYRGLSGIDCAAFGVVAGHLLREGWRVVRLRLLAKRRTQAIVTFNVTMIRCHVKRDNGLRVQRHHFANYRNCTRWRGWVSLALGGVACVGAVAKCVYTP